MKYRLFLYVVSLFIFGTTLTKAQSSAPAGSVTADQIISRHLDSIGGAAAWRKIHSMKLTGAVTVQGTDITVDVTAVQNTGARSDITMMGMAGYTITTPTSGWVYMPFSGQQKPEALTADQVKFSQDELDIQGALVDYKLKGSTVKLEDKEDVQGTECWKVKLTMKNGIVKTEYFDPDSYLLIREVTKATIDGKVEENTTDYSNFQKLPEGITVPMSIGSPMGTLIVKKVEVNVPVADSLFQSPKI
jgi:hypothetical protein